MNEIILVQPKSGIWDRLGERPPESLLAIAARPFKEGYKVRILDTRLHRDWKKELAKHLMGNPICVGLTS